MTAAPRFRLLHVALLAGVVLGQVPSAKAQVLPRAWLIQTLPHFATAQFFGPVPTPQTDQEQEELGAEPEWTDTEAAHFSYGLLALDGRHYPGPRPDTISQLKATTAAFGWRSMPQEGPYQLELGLDFARWRPLRSHGPGEADLPLSPSQRSPLWAIDRLRLGIALKGDYRVAFTDPKHNRGFIRSPLGWPTPGWSQLEPPMIAAEIAREAIGRYEGRAWIGQGIGEAVNLVEGGLAVAGYVTDGIIGYSRGTLSEAKPDRTSRQFKSMVRAEWRAGFASDGRWPLAYGLYFGIGVGGSSGVTDRPLESTIAGRCYQCFAQYQRYQRNLVSGYATYFILARYFVHIEGHDMEQTLGQAKSRTTAKDHYSYQAIGTLLRGGRLGYLSLGFYRGHRTPYPAAAPDSLEPSRPSFVLRWGLGQIYTSVP